MNRRQMMMLSSAALAVPAAPAQSQEAPGAVSGATPDTFLLKDYRPISIYRVAATEIKKAKFPVVDVHCHGFRPPQQVDDMVRLLDASNIEKIVIFTGASTADRFKGASQPYAKYPKRFDLWCGFDFTGADQPDFGPGAVRSLEECHRAGAVGVGEISDKGWGFRAFSGFPGGRGAAGRGRGGARGPSTPPAHPGPHVDDPRMDALLDKLRDLGMPMNIHVSDPIWAYQPMDLHNDGLMNGYTWRIDDKQPGILGHNGLIESLERAVEKHPRTIFIACHVANLDYDLARLGGMLDRHANLYADISARFGELAPIPRMVAQFLTKYQDRILYGTDMGYSEHMLGTTFRILESRDEHFYAQDLFNYHWPLHGFGLPDAVLRKVYGDNARKVFQRAKGGAA